MKPSPLVCLAATLLFVVSLHGQAPGTLDTNYVTLAGTDVLPQVVISLADGKVLAGGNFTNYAGSGRAGLVRLNAGGTVDTSFQIPAPMKVFAGPLMRTGCWLRSFDLTDARYSSGPSPTWEQKHWPFPK